MFSKLYLACALWLQCATQTLAGGNTYTIANGVTPDNGARLISFGFVNNRNTPVLISQITSACGNESVSVETTVFYRLNHLINEASDWTVTNVWTETGTSNRECVSEVMTFDVSITIPARETASFVVGGLSEDVSISYVDHVSTAEVILGEDVSLVVGGSSGWGGTEVDGSYVMRFNPCGFVGTVTYGNVVEEAAAPEGRYTKFETETRKIEEQIRRRDKKNTGASRRSYSNAPSGGKTATTTDMFAEAKREVDTFFKNTKARVEEKYKAIKTNRREL